MSETLLALITAIVTYGPRALTLWNTLRPILSEGREPTEDEWATLNKMRDDVHAQVQEQT